MYNQSLNGQNKQNKQSERWSGPQNVQKQGSMFQSSNDRLMVIREVQVETASICTGDADALVVVVVIFLHRLQVTKCVI